MPLPRGRPPYSPLPAERAAVSALAAYGVDQEAMCLEVWLARKKALADAGQPSTNEKPITLKTLRKHFKSELETGLARANSRVWESVYNRATNLKHPQGAVSAFYWLNTRGGQRPTARVEHTGKVAWELDLEGASLEEIEVMERVLARQAAKLGALPAPANDVAAA